MSRNLRLSRSVLSVPTAIVNIHEIVHCTKRRTLIAGLLRHYRRGRRVSIIAKDYMVYLDTFNSATGFLNPVLCNLHCMTVIEQELSSS